MVSPRAWQLLLPMPAPCVRQTAVPREEVDRRLEELGPTIERTTRSLRCRRPRLARRVDVRSLVLEMAWRVASTWRPDGGAAMTTLVVDWSRRLLATLVLYRKRPAAMAEGRRRPGRDEANLGLAERDWSDRRSVERCPVVDDLLAMIRRRVHPSDRHALEVLLRSETMTEAAAELGCCKERVRQRRMRIADRCLDLLSQGDESEREMWRRRLGLAGKEARKRRASGG